MKFVVISLVIPCGAPFSFSLALPPRILYNLPGMQEMIPTAPHRPAVSVVVPVYKVERYLRQCVDSLLAQTLRDIEIILVDDGSPDACPALVDEYAAADPRVRAVHQSNGGYGKAVNAGLARARGRYIGIIESDDWIEPDMYAKLLARAEETGADIVKCGFYKYDSTQAPDSQNLPWTGGMQNLFAAPDTPFRPCDWPPVFAYHASLWSNLYRAGLLEEIRVIESPSAAYQDMPFVMETLSRANSMSVVKEYLVHYRMEQGQGSSSTCKDARLMRMLDMTELSLHILQRNGALPAVKEAFYLQAFSANYLFCMDIAPAWRREYFTRLHHMVQPWRRETDFRADYFSRKWKKRLAQCYKGNYTGLWLALCWKSLRHKLASVLIPTR